MVALARRRSTLAVWILTGTFAVAFPLGLFAAQVKDDEEHHRAAVALTGDLELLASAAGEYYVEHSAYPETITDLRRGNPEVSDVVIDDSILELRFQPSGDGQALYLEGAAGEDGTYSILLEEGEVTAKRCKGAGCPEGGDWSQGLREP